MSEVQSNNLTSKVAANFWCYTSSPLSQGAASTRDSKPGPHSTEYKHVVAPEDIFKNENIFNIVLVITLKFLYQFYAAYNNL